MTASINDPTKMQHDDPREQRRETLERHDILEGHDTLEQQLYTLKRKYSIHRLSTEKLVHLVKNKPAAFESLLLAAVAVANASVERDVTGARFPFERLTMNGNPALHIAIQAGSYEVADMLYEQACKFKQYDILEQKDRQFHLSPIGLCLLQTKFFPLALKMLKDMMALDLASDTLLQAGTYYPYSPVEIALARALTGENQQLFTSILALQGPKHEALQSHLSESTTNLYQKASLFAQTRLGLDNSSHPIPLEQLSRLASAKSRQQEAGSQTTASAGANLEAGGSAASTGCSDPTSSSSPVLIKAKVEQEEVAPTDKQKADSSLKQPRVNLCELEQQNKSTAKEGAKAQFKQK